MDSPNYFDLKQQYYDGTLQDPPQYYSRGQPIPRTACERLTPWSYNGTPAKLAQFAYPCRGHKEGCCASMFDLTNPANRKGGEYYHMLSDVHNYDHDGFTYPWWGSAQRAPEHCGWQQGLPAQDRPALATQPALNLERDYEYLNPNHAHFNNVSNFTRAPLPGAPPCQNYLRYYGKKDQAVQPERYSLLANDYAWWTRELIQALKNNRGRVNDAAEAAFATLVQVHRHIASGSGSQKFALVLDELANRIIALVKAHYRDDVKEYVNARTRLYEQGEMVATTQTVSKVLQDAWRGYLRKVIEQIEVDDPNVALQVFQQARDQTKTLFLV